MDLRLEEEGISRDSSSIQEKKKNPKSGRIRTTMACDLCSRLRQKCSGEKPCSSCVAKSRECLYTRKKARRGPPKLDSLLAAKRMLEEQLMIRSFMQGAAQPSKNGNQLNLSAQSTSNQALPSLSLSKIGGMVSSQSINISCSTSASYSFSGPLDGPVSSSKLSNILLLRHSDFRCLLVWDESGWSCFLDYYFKHMYRSFPFLSYEWFNENMEYIPLYYLHAMYACALISSSSQVTMPPEQSLATTEAAHVYYKKSLEIIVRDPEAADPFMVAALYHLFYFVLHSPDVRDKDAVTHYTLAVRLCQLLQIWRPDFQWNFTKSPAASINNFTNPKENLISFPRFSLGVWFAVQILDIRVTSIFGIDSLLKSPINLKNLGCFYLSPLSAISFNDRNQDSLYHDHDLALIDYNLPLANLVKLVAKRNEFVDDVLLPVPSNIPSNPALYQVSRDRLLLQQSHALKKEFDRWFTNLPPAFQIWPGQNAWKGALIMELNCMYHVSSIFIYISLNDNRIFLPDIGMGGVASGDEAFIHPATSCLVSANMIVSMAQALNQQFSNFLSISSSSSTTHIPLASLIYLEYAIFIAALTLCAFDSNINRTKISVEYHLLYALRICGASCAFVKGPMTRDSCTFDPDIIRSCIGYPDRAMMVLRQRMIGDRL